MKTAATGKVSREDREMARQEARWTHWIIQVNGGDRVARYCWFNRQFGRSVFGRQVRANVRSWEAGGV